MEEERKDIAKEDGEENMEEEEEITKEEATSKEIEKSKSTRRK